MLNLPITFQEHCRLLWVPSLNFLTLITSKLSSRSSKLKRSVLGSISWDLSYLLDLAFKAVGYKNLFESWGCPLGWISNLGATVIISRSTVYFWGFGASKTLRLTRYTYDFLTYAAEHVSVLWEFQHGLPFYTNTANPNKNQCCRI